jgi:hypothetical protein
MNRSYALVVNTRANDGTSPSNVRTRGGAVFDPRADIWSYKEDVKSVSINFESVTLLSSEMQQSYKAVLLWYAQNASPSHLHNMHSHFGRFVRFLASTQPGIGEISKFDLLNYKSAVSTLEPGTLSSLSGFLRKWTV